MEVCGESDSGAETEEDAQAVKDHVHERVAEPVDEGCGQEVQKCEQPPDADK